MPLKIALPKGRLLRGTAALLQKAGWALDEYHSRLSFYRPKSAKFPELQIKVLHEKDIPIQVAVGNYDLGICGRDWLEELQVKYPSSALVRLSDLGYGRAALWVVAHPSPGFASLAAIKAGNGIIRIASEYPHLAEAFALGNRLGWFRVFPVWGAAESYPPENAELALVRAGSAAEIAGCGLVPLSQVLDCSAHLIANRHSWEGKEMAAVVASIGEVAAASRSSPAPEAAVTLTAALAMAAPAEGALRLALPDGHQQEPTAELLARAGIRMRDYPSVMGNRRPGISLEGVRVKVIRPQDMPLQVAGGNFDLAITGKDWLREHLYQFPTSPVRELLDLGYGRVKIVAVVSRELPAEGPADLRNLSREWTAPVRIASEYVHIADKYARDNRLERYRLIPTWGATEAFLPDDADLLIENTETGRTIARHNLKIIDTVFESAACLIGNGGSPAAKEAGAIVRLLEKAVGKTGEA